MRNFSLIAAVCENMGIGIKGDLPWKLKNELKYFSSTTKKVSDPTKRNAVIMGRKTYFGVPESKRPLPGRLNIVLSRNPNPVDFPLDIMLCTSLVEAMEMLDHPEYKDIENVWIVGGSGVYKEAMESEHCHRIFVTQIKATFECDTFFPNIDENRFKIVENDADIPTGIQEEDGIEYEYKVYEKV